MDTLTTKLLFPLLIAFAMLVVGVPAIAETVVKEENGMHITIERDVNVSRQGVGTVHSLETIKLLSDKAATGKNREYTLKRNVDGIMACASLSLVPGLGTWVAMGLSAACGFATLDYTPDLRKGDWLITDILAGAAGGAGGISRTRSIALGKRDGNVVVLWLTFQSNDKDGAQTWAATQFSRYK